MAPGKFGLFKGRSRDCPEPPSTENLLNSCSDLVACPSSPLPSTSQGLCEGPDGYHEFSLLHIDSDDEDESEKVGVARRSSDSKVEEAQINYNPLPSTNATSTTTLEGSLNTDPHYDIIQDYDAHTYVTEKYDYQKNEMEKYNFQNNGKEKYDFQNNGMDKFDIKNLELASPDDATSIDANSLQFDQTSIYSEDIKYCGASKKQRRNKAKEEQKIQELQNDSAMWQASNFEVIEHLLARSGTLDEQIKWEAIATARGLCTLTAACACGDCRGGRAPAALTDGDAGMGAAPLLGAVSVGCALI